MQTWLEIQVLRRRPASDWAELLGWDSKCYRKLDDSLDTHKKKNEQYKNNLSETKKKNK